MTSKTDELLGRKQDLEETMATLQQRLASLREQQQQQEPVVLKACVAGEGEGAAERD